MLAFSWLSPTSNASDELPLLKGVHLSRSTCTWAKCTQFAFNVLFIRWLVCACACVCLLLEINIFTKAHTHTHTQFDASPERKGFECAWLLALCWGLGFGLATRQLAEHRMAMQT